MKAIRFIFLLLIAFFILQSCKKNDMVTPQSYSKQLKLDPVKRAYYNNVQKRYETNYFTADSMAFAYTITLEPNKKYRILVYGISMQYVELNLLRNTDIIKMGVQANVANTAKYIVYTSNASETLQIIISASNASIFNQAFYLTFEEVNTYSLLWKGHRWICDGDWEVNTVGQLVFKGYNSGFSKWAKLADSSFTDYYTAEVDFTTSGGVLNTFVGMAVDASSTVFEMINLPESCKQFKISNATDWELWHINIATSGGIARNTGNLATALHTGKNTISCKSDATDTFFGVNDETPITLGGPYSAPYHEFYITVEDFGNSIQLIDDVTFTNQ